ncbi:D-hexose-6-phosphate mutarotase [Litorivivens sp.]|uniref:D-hexose-6-phosphate mutarotase n=1 Tax=Litorivivens sp. TaxID=2020868 RepID=UPI0035665134
MQSADNLRQLFPESPHWHFSESRAGFPLLHLIDGNTQATVSVYGAQLLSYCPAAQEDVLWLSDDARFQQGKSIRGGIPLCWPWFGPHPNDSDKPAHGFVRNRYWQLTALTRVGDASLARFRLSEFDQTLYQPKLSLELEISVGDSLKVQLTTTNNSQESATVSSALHSYFAISDIGDIQITGLEDKPFRDAVNNNSTCLQRGPIRFSGELDRVYQNVDAEICIHDPGLERVISISGTGSQSAVVWNPWVEKSLRLGDMGKDGYRNMVCVETANADQDARTLKPGATHHLVACIQVKP